MQIKASYNCFNELFDLLKQINTSYGLDINNISISVSFKNSNSNFDFYNKDSTLEAVLDMDSDYNLNFFDLVVLTEKDNQEIAKLLNCSNNGMSVKKKRILKDLFYSVYANLYHSNSQDFNEIEYDKLLPSIIMNKVNQREPY